MSYHHSNCVLIFMLMASSCLIAQADEVELFDYPGVGGSIDFSAEMKRESSDLPGAKSTTESVFSVEPDLIIGFTERFSIAVDGALDFEKTDDSRFSDPTLHFETLTANYGNDDIAVYGGKFTPNFGIAWDRAMGMFGAELAEDYEFSERIGLGGHVGFGNPRSGEYSLSASTFYLDTTGLSDTLINRTGRTRLQDGGVSNTEDFSSFALALDGEVRGWFFHAGLISQDQGTFAPLEEDDDEHERRLAAAEDNEDDKDEDESDDEAGEPAAGDEDEDETEAPVARADERGVVIALGREIEIGEDDELTVFTEYAHFDDAGGVAGDQTDYLTVGAELGRGENWAFGLSYSTLELKSGSESERTNSLAVQAAYTFDNGVEVELGWQSNHEQDEDNNVIGATVSYEYGL